MHPVIAAQLKEFSGTHSEECLSEPEFFEVFSIHSIENGLLGSNVDPFGAHLEASEFGIDGLAIIVQGELCTNVDQVAEALAVGKNHSVEFHFFQSKTAEHVDYGDISKFLDSVVDFFKDGRLAKSAQISDLRECKKLIYSSTSKKNPNIRCFFVQPAPGIFLIRYRP